MKKEPSLKDQPHLRQGKQDKLTNVPYKKKNTKQTAKEQRDWNQF